MPPNGDSSYISGATGATERPSMELPAHWICVAAESSHDMQQGCQMTRSRAVERKLFRKKGGKAFLRKRYETVSFQFRISYFSYFFVFFVFFRSDRYSFLHKNLTSTQ